MGWLGDLCKPLLEVFQGRKHERAAFAAVTARCLALVETIEREREYAHTQIHLLRNEVHAVKIELAACEELRGQMQQQLDDIARELAKQREFSVPSIVIADSNGIITEWYPNATRMFHWSSEEALGKSINILIPPRLRNTHYLAFNNAAMENRAPKQKELETFALTREGEEFPVSISLDSWEVKNGDLSTRFYSAEIRYRK